METGEWDLVVENFVPLYKIMVAKGHIDDAEFIQRGFPADRNLNGEEVYCTPSVTQENMQRAKIMDHPYQVALRAQRFLEVKATKAGQKRVQLKAKVERKLDKNRECEKRLFRLMELPETTGRRCMSDATLPHFDKCTADLLKAF